MTILENIKMALANVRANKIRSILTMLGIIIGISSVIAILSVGNAMSAKVSDSLSSFGATNIMAYVTTKQEDNLMVSNEVTRDDKISLEQINLLREKLGSDIRGIGFTIGAPGYQAKKKSKEANISTVGVADDYDEVNNIKLLTGRFIEKDDEASNKNVAVISDKVVNNLFGGDVSRALGSRINVESEESSDSFTIIGVYRYEIKGGFLAGADRVAEKDINTNIYIPYTVAMELNTDKDVGYFEDLTISAKDTDSVTKVEEAIKDFFRPYYASNDTWQIKTQATKSILDSSNDTMKMLSFAIAVIAGISLIVGGIGVMNIMLVSVTERTREIGVRKALGATNNNIRVQFIVESMIVCLLGGVIGVLIGGSLGYFASSIIHVAKLPSLLSVVISVSFSMGIGLFFGYYPANKAAQLDPIDALRYE